jgi:hypothetical protein
MSYQTQNVGAALMYLSQILRQLDIVEPFL